MTLPFRIRPALTLGLLTLAGVLLVMGIRGARAQSTAEVMRDFERLVRPVIEAHNAGRYEGALTIGRMFEDYRLGRGEIYLGRYLCSSEWQTGKGKAALARAEALVARFPEDIEALVLTAGYARQLGQDERADELLKKVNEIARTTEIDREDPFLLVALGKAALDLGADPSKVLQSYFDPAAKTAPWLAEAWIAAGEVALEKRDFARAGKTFRNAVKQHPDDADIAFGLARALGPSDGEAAKEALERCLELRSNHDGALLLLAGRRIDEEQYDEAATLAQEVLRTAPDHPEAWAHLSAIAQIRGRDEDAEEARMRALGRWHKNPEVDFTIGERLARKYRFEPAAEAQRRALEMDPDFTKAKTELAQNLLRIGDEEGAWKVVEELREEDPYSVIAFNLEKLQKNLGQFTERRAPGFLLRMPEIEAEAYADRALELLTEARDVLGKKYGYTPARDTLVEFFDKQGDFAVRTLGVPGGEGLLGACFGHVITMNSPGGLGAGRNNWEATLWHEMCHVITLGATANRMPRWLSEGISVHEERLRDPTWGQWMTPQYRSLILDEGGLVPLSELSGAFGGEVDIGFAYYESSLVVEFILETFGQEALLRVLDRMREGKTDEEALGSELEALGKLDRDFQAFAEKKALALAPTADWSEPTEIELLDPNESLRKKPRNLVLLRAEARILAEELRWAELEGIARRLIELYPEDTGRTGGHALLAAARAGQEDPAGEKAALEEIAIRSAETIGTFRRLADLAADSEDWPAVGRYASKVMAVNPMLPRIHYLKATSQEALEDEDGALAWYQRWLALGPTNPAQAHYHVGRLQIGRDDAQAKRHLLDALSLAPRYRDAYRELRRLRER